MIGLDRTVIQDYLAAPPMSVASIVTNAPFCRAVEFAEKALGEVAYVAFLTRTNFFMEATGRDQFFEDHSPARVHFASLRLPAMHRYGYDGKKSAPNAAFCFLVWDRNPTHPHGMRRFNWRKLQSDATV